MENYTDTRQTVAEFCVKNRISMTAERTDANPHNKDWTDADHWKIKLVRRDEPGERYNVNGHGVAVGKIASRMTTYFSMGYGHKGAEPKPEGVLSCLASDSASIDRSFPEWADDMGYDSDSRKAERIYKACERGADQLKRFLGDELYHELLYDTQPE